MFLGQPFFIFLMVQFIRGIPMELDESALIDGCMLSRLPSSPFADSLNRSTRIPATSSR